VESVIGVFLSSGGILGQTGGQTLAQCGFNHGGLTFGLKPLSSYAINLLNAIDLPERTSQSYQCSIHWLREAQLHCRDLESLHQAFSL
jgi:hypothetical protein